MKKSWIIGGGAAIIAIAAWQAAPAIQNAVLPAVVSWAMSLNVVVRRHEQVARMQRSGIRDGEALV